MSLFITFEGDEGSGKTTQARTLYRALARRGIPSVLTREPGGTPAGERIARWLKWSKNVDISPLTELLMFNASRAQLLEEIVRPELAGGKVVVCDRYTDSTVAYQSYGRGLDLTLTKTVNASATGGLVPDLTVLLDISPEEGLARKSTQRSDRFEQEALDFHRRVRAGFLALAAAEPERWLVLDATQPRATNRKLILEKVLQMLPG